MNWRSFCISPLVVMVCFDAAKGEDAAECVPHRAASFGHICFEAALRPLRRAMAPAIVIQELSLAMVHEARLRRHWGRTTRVHGETVS